MGRLIENGMKLTSIGASRGNETINSISLMINEIVELICFHWTLKATPLFDEWEEIGFVFLSFGGLWAVAPPMAPPKGRERKQKTNQSHESTKRESELFFFLLERLSFFHFEEMEEKTKRTRRENNERSTKQPRCAARQKRNSTKQMEMKFVLWMKLR